MNKFKKRRAEWDIETGPEAEAIVRKFYEPPASFSVDACKREFATARKPGKEGEEFIARKEAEAKLAAADHWAKFLDRAALSPLTGRVLAIGIRENGKSRILLARNDAEEKAAIAEFLKYAADVTATGGDMEGFNIFQFDLSFLFRRGLKYGLNVHVLRQGRFWAGVFRDILEIWRAGDRTVYISLNQLAEFLGTEHRKNGDGAEFAKTMATDEAKAASYLDNDLLMTEEVGLAVTPEPDAARGEDAADDLPFVAA